MISASKKALSLNNLKILSYKVTKNLTNFPKKFCESHPDFWFIVNKVFLQNPLWIRIASNLIGVVISTEKIAVKFIYSLHLYFEWKYRLPFTQKFPLLQLIINLHQWFLTFYARRTLKILIIIIGFTDPWTIYPTIKRCHLGYITSL